MNNMLLNSKKLLLVFGAYLLGMAFFITNSQSQEISILQNHNIEQAIDIAADSLEVHQSENLAIFKGSVVVKQGELNMTANDLSVFYDNSLEGLDPTIARIDATGEVKITSSTERAEGDWGVYDVKGRLITMGGSVVLQRGENVIVGERLELDLVTGITKMDGEGQSNDRVTGKFRIPKKPN